MERLPINFTLLIQIVLISAFYFPHKLHADIFVCNDTDTVLNVAVGFNTGNRDISFGWWKIANNECSRTSENFKGEF